jgi:Flp pilus assembly CpaE family ATPase
VLDEAPGLAAACRSAARGRLDAHGLAAHALAVDDHLRVLTGATRPDRWRELRPAALNSVWACARELADDVVVDLGAGLAADPADPLDVAVGPAGVARAVLAEADRVLVVGTADPLGMLRLVHALDQLGDQVPHASYDVVVNRVRPSVAGARPERQVRQSLMRFTGVETVHLLPDDPDAVDKALRDGMPLTEAAPSSPLRRSIGTLASALAPVAPAARHSGGRGSRRLGRRAAASVRSVG